MTLAGLEPAALLVNALPVALLGGVLGLDMVSFPQIMMARPLVSATLAGAFLGSPSLGLLIGVLLELIALETLPFGASRYAEWGSAGTVGGAVIASHPANAPGALPVAMLAALAAAVLSSRSMVVLRLRTGRYARAMHDEVAAGNYRAVTTVQLRGLTTDLLRGTLVTYVSLLAFIPLAAWLVSAWHTDAVHARAFVTAIAATIAAGAVWSIFHSTARAGWLFLVGLALGGAVLAFGGI